MDLGNFFSNFIPGARSTAPNPVAPVAQAVGAIPATAAAGGATVNTAATAANGLVPAAATPATPESKLVDFADIWNTAPSTPNGPMFDLTKDKALELARKSSFTPTMTAEQAAAIQAGGPEALAAMQAVINDSAQQAYAQSTHAATQLIEAAAKKMNASAQSSMEAAINKRQINSSLQEANPLLSNPAVAPLIKMTTDQLTQKHPTASPQEIAAMANSYIAGLAEAFTAPQAQKAAAAKQAEVAAKEPDWTKFFDQ